MPGHRKWQTSRPWSGRRRAPSGSDGAMGCVGAARALRATWRAHGRCPQAGWSAPSASSDAKGQLVHLARRVGREDVDVGVRRPGRDRSDAQFSRGARSAARGREQGGAGAVGGAWPLLGGVATPARVWKAKLGRHDEWRGRISARGGRSSRASTWGAEGGRVGLGGGPGLPRPEELWPRMLDAGERERPVKGWSGLRRAGAALLGGRGRAPIVRLAPGRVPRGTWRARRRSAARRTPPAPSRARAAV